MQNSWTLLSAAGREIRRSVMEVVDDAATAWFLTWKWWQALSSRGLDRRLRNQSWACPSLTQAWLSLSEVKDIDLRMGWDDREVGLCGSCAGGSAAFVVRLHMEGLWQRRRGALTRWVRLGGGVANRRYRALLESARRLKVKELRESARCRAAVRLENFRLFSGPVLVCRRLWSERRRSYTL